MVNSLFRASLQSVFILTAALTASSALMPSGWAQSVPAETAPLLEAEQPAARPIVRSPDWFRRQARRPAPPRRLPPNRVQPGGGLDVAARACGATEEAVTALVPVNNPVYTASAQPTFLFYLPDAPEMVDYAEFILLSADEKQQVYSAQFVPTRPGIVSVSLPAEVALESEQAYHWYLSVHCQTTADVPAVDGWVQRVAGTSAPEPTDSALPVIWYDAIALAAAALTAPTAQPPSPQIQAQWERWLTAAGLAEVANVPIVGPIMPYQITANQ